jgi:hypothetical protein
VNWRIRLALLHMPDALKLRAAREVSGDFTDILARRLEDNPSGGLEAYREAARETGRRAAERLRREAGLGATAEDVEAAWRLVSNIAGFRYSVTGEAGRAVFDHEFCPAYASGGERMCENFCLPMVEGLTTALCPSCGIEIVRPAADGRPCAKALVWKR